MKKLFLILLVSSLFAGCSFKKDKTNASTDATTEPTTAATSKPEITQVKPGFTLFKSTSFPYQIQYPSQFIHEEKNDILGDPERIVFTNSKLGEPVSSFMFSVTKGTLPNPQKIYIDVTGSQKISGKYKLADMEAEYISLPSGQGAGEEGVPRVDIFAQKNGIVYGFIFRGTSDYNEEMITQILSTFQLTH